MWTQFLVNDYSRFLADDSLRSSHPIEVDVSKARAIADVYDAISYSKGYFRLYPFSSLSFSLSPSPPPSLHPLPPSLSVSYLPFVLSLLLVLVSLFPSHFLNFSSSSPLIILSSSFFSTASLLLHFSLGASVIRMVENYLGKATFKKGINLYLNRFKFRNATTQGKFNSLNSEGMHGKVTFFDL